jgi:hypothetical protein
LDTLITKEEVLPEQWQFSVLEEHPGSVSSVWIATLAFPSSPIAVTLPSACFMVHPLLQIKYNSSSSCFKDVLVFRVFFSTLLVP